MKKISIIVLWCSILLIVAFNSIKVSLKADEENSQNLFEGFVCEKVKECYYCVEIDGEYEISRSILLYTGTYNNNEAYILYSTETNQVIEYSLNSQHPWSRMNYNSYIYIS